VPTQETSSLFSQSSIANPLAELN